MMEKSPEKENLFNNLELNRPKGKRRHLKSFFIFIVILIALFIIMKTMKDNPNAAIASYKTQKATLGDLTITVSATGSLEPRNQVDVGSEMSGIVKTVNVDFNDHVEKGQVLTTLDTSKMEAQVKQSRASLEAAKAQVLDARATVKEAQYELDRLRQVWEASGNKVPSKHELDSADARLQRAIASEASANAQVSQAEATLEVNETDLDKMVIRSPVNGIVLNREIEPGQTVAASFQAPVLFTMAEDLTKMELSVYVDEADVGMVKIGQDAGFTVDAYPDRTFKAKILQVRYGSETTEGVVTYKTLLSVDNEDLLLRPGMTATAEIIVKNIENTIIVPNAALRFEPPMVKNAPSPSDEKRGMMSRLMPGPPSRPDNMNNTPVDKGNGPKTVWVLRNNIPEPVSITTGLTDGSMTQVTGGDLKTDMNIITGMVGQ